MKSADVLQIVVTLAEQFPEGETATEAWFRAMVDRVKLDLAAFRHADPMRPIFDEDRAHLIGTSGAITSLAGMHLRLPRYLVSERADSQPHTPPNP